MRVIDLRLLYEDSAKLADLATYESRAKAAAGEGEDVVLTGQAPIWMYLKVAHALHGRVRRLSYRSPALGQEDLVIFNHDAR